MCKERGDTVYLLSQPITVHEKSTPWKKEFLFDSKCATTLGFLRKFAENSKFSRCIVCECSRVLVIYYVSVNINTEHLTKVAAHLRIYNAWQCFHFLLLPMQKKAIDSSAFWSFSLSFFFFYRRQYGQPFIFVRAWYTLWRLLLGRIGWWWTIDIVIEIECTIDGHEWVCWTRNIHQNGHSDCNRLYWRFGKIEFMSW